MTKLFELTKFVTVLIVLKLKDLEKKKEKTKDQKWEKFNDIKEANRP